MRTIKFKAKNRIREWVKGDLLQHLDGTVYIGENEGPWTDDGLCNSDYTHVEIVDPDTVCQFTGFLDKNGKEIYEGDIIRYTDVDSFIENPDCDPWAQFRRYYAIVRETVVVFKDGMFCNDDGCPICWLGHESIENLRDCLNIPDDEDCDVLGTIINESLLGIEVIGNIYDNPEL